MTHRMHSANNDKGESPVLRRAHRLAKMPAKSIGSIALSYGSMLDLRVLGVSEAICRSRKEADKVRVIQRNIKRLRKELKNDEHGTA